MMDRAWKPSPGYYSTSTDIMQKRASDRKEMDSNGIDPLPERGTPKALIR